MAGISRIAQSKRNVLSAFRQVKNKLETADDLTSLTGTLAELNVAANDQRGSYKANRLARESILETTRVSEEIFKLSLALTVNFSKFEPEERVRILSHLEQAIFHTDFVDEEMQKQARAHVVQAKLELATILKLVE
jgi:hypothetical protein